MSAGLGRDHELQVLVEAVEEEVGRGHGAWDMVNPREIVAAALKCAARRAPASDVGPETQGERERSDADVMYSIARALKVCPITLHTTEHTEEQRARAPSGLWISVDRGLLYRAAAALRSAPLGEPAIEPLQGFGAYLRERRVAEGLSLRECAAARGISAGALGQIERGYATWASLADALLAAHPLATPVVAHEGEPWSREQLRAALEQAGEWFSNYAEMHRAKCNDSKADVNQQKADYCRHAARNAGEPEQPREAPLLHEEREYDVLCCCGDHLRPTAPEQPALLPLRHEFAIEEAALALMQAARGPGIPQREAARIAVETYQRALILPGSPSEAP